VGAIAFLQVQIKGEGDRSHRPLDAVAARSLMHEAELPFRVPAQARRSYNATRETLTAKSDGRGSVQMWIAERQGP
jgi:hypothetical protein